MSDNPSLRQAIAREEARLARIEKERTEAIAKIQELKGRLAGEGSVPIPPNSPASNRHRHPRSGGAYPPGDSFSSGRLTLSESIRAIWFGECKWSGKKVGTDVYQDLRRKSERVEWHGGKRNERFILYSRSGFTPGMFEVGKREKVVLVEGESTLR